MPHATLGVLPNEAMHLTALRAAGDRHDVGRTRVPADDVSRMVAVIAAAWIGLAPWLGADAQVGRVGPDRTAGARQSASDDCVRFESPAKLAAGTPFRVALLRGLEFRLSASWDISVGPVDEPTMDYLWLVSPPIQTAPHRMIGPGYGLSARQSARIERPLRFLVTGADYDAARAVIDLRSAEEILKRMDQLGRGRLSFVITDFQIRDVTFADGRQGDAFDWITFKGEACVPKEKGSDIARGAG